MKDRRPVSEIEKKDIIALCREGALERDIAEIVDRDPRTVARIVAKHVVARGAFDRQTRALSDANDRERERRSIRPPQITAPEFEPEWWEQNDKSFCAGFTRAVRDERVATRQQAVVGGVEADTRFDSTGGIREQSRKQQ